MNATRKTIFVDAHSLDKGYHGTHTFLRELYLELLSRYADLDIYFGTYDPVSVQRVFPGLAADHILAYKPWRPQVLRFLYDIPRFLSRYRFDYAHFQYLGVPWRTRTRSIVTLHDVLYEDYPADYPALYRLSRKWLFSGSLHRADIKTTVSGYSRARIAEHYHVPQSEIHIIPNAVAPVKFRRPEAVDRIRSRYGLENFLLYVSRVEPRKNHLLLLETYLELELYRQRIPLVFIGAESIPVPDLQERLDGLTNGQRRWIYHLSDVDPVDLSAFYSACRVFIYPSRAEGFGIPPLEAALCEAPVLCSRGAAMADYRFFDPYTFDPSDRRELKDKLTDMIQYPPGAGFLQQVSERVTHMYSRAASARAFYSLIQQNSLAWN